MSKYKILVVLLILSLSYGKIFAVLACDCEGDHDCLEQRQDVPRHGGGASGRWIDTETPKGGWNCTDVEDIGSAMETCQMCNREEIRYVHHMRHPAYPKVIGVGCICAAYMEGALNSRDGSLRQDIMERAKNRQSELVNRFSRRERFTELQGWKESKNGNPYIKYHDYLIVITHSDKYGRSSYSAMIDGKFLNKWCSNEQEAKLTAFDVLYPPVHRVGIYRQ